MSDFEHAVQEAQRLSATPEGKQMVALLQQLDGINMQQAMDQAYPSLTRPIQLSPERYNQHLTTGSLILEVGTCGNSLTEVVRAAELFAEAAAPVLRSLTGG